MTRTGGWLGWIPPVESAGVKAAHPSLLVESRRKIFACVEANPGAHLRAIARLTGLPLGTTNYHLDRLAACGLLVARRDGRYKRFFSESTPGAAQRELLTALRHRVPRRIVATLLDVQLATQDELRALVGTSRSTVSAGLAGLVERGIVGSQPTWPRRSYFLLEPATTRRTLDAHATGMDDPIMREASR